ncbi:Two pore calcium channel protein 1 [Trichoplax sp. H2]|nr:Two pore calcium channel protein 1 [Trichoplax sp. H2]|eukprot:RDD46419.1 Two pore calcium channel protein 1 [Trichoplax sp. H2]
MDTAENSSQVDLFQIAMSDDDGSQQKNENNGSQQENENDGSQQENDNGSQQENDDITKLSSQTNLEHLKMEEKEEKTANNQTLQNANQQDQSIHPPTGDDHHHDAKESAAKPESNHNEDSSQANINQNGNEENYINDTDLLYAAIMVEDARRGRKGAVMKKMQALKQYQLYFHPLMRFLLYLTITLNFALALFERPAVPGLELPVWATMVMELYCLVFFLLRLLHNRQFVPSAEKFWKDSKSILIIATLLVTVIDMIVYIAMTASGNQQHALRVSRILRPMFIVNFAENRQIRRGLRNIRRTIPKSASVILLLLLCIAMFALLALKLFQSRNLYNPNGTPYFTRLDDSFWRLYVLLTTANDPDVMMPAYDLDNWFALFFISFMIVCYFILNNILLAVVYQNYRSQLREDIAKSVFIRRKLLKNAYNVLGAWTNHHDVYVTREAWCQLLLRMNSLHGSKFRGDTQIHLLWEILDKDDKGYIGLDNFLQVAELLNVEILEVKDQVHYLQRRFPRFYGSKYSVILRKIVLHKFFRYFFDFSILVNAVMIGIGIDAAEIFFLTLFNIEIVLKLYTLGVKEFARIFWNSFDFLVIVSATIMTIIESSQNGWAHTRALLDFVMVLRVLRIIKLIGDINRFQVIVRTVSQILPTFATYGGILLIFYYVYAILGMELFSGLIRYYGYPNGSQPFNQTLLFCGNIKLKGSGFYADRYCGNNFNNLLKSFVLLIELTIVNQWHDILSKHK